MSYFVGGHADTCRVPLSAAVGTSRATPQHLLGQLPPLVSVWTVEETPGLVYANTDAHVEDTPAPPFNPYMTLRISGGLTEKEAIFPRLYDSKYAMLGLSDYHVVHNPGEGDYEAEYLGRADLANVGGPAEDDLAHQATILYALGSLLAHVHYTRMHDAMGFCVLFARPTPDTLPRFYLALDASEQQKHLENDADDHDLVGRLAWSLARLAYVPSQRDASLMYSAFKRGYIDGAGQHTLMAKHVLREMQEFV